MTTHPTPPDQTAAAQEREALIRAKQEIANMLDGQETIIQGRRKLNMELPTRLDEQRKAFKVCADLIDAALSTAQREPSMDVEALKEEIWKRCPKTPSMWETMVYNGKIPDWINDAFKARGLLTGRTEAKAEKRYIKPEDAAEVMNQMIEQWTKANGMTTENLKDFQLSIKHEVNGTVSYAIEQKSYREAETKAEGDMVPTREMVLRGFAAYDGTMTDFNSRLDNIREIYLAMRSAAPPVQQEQKS